MEPFGTLGRSLSVVSPGVANAATRSVPEILDSVWSAAMCGTGSDVAGEIALGIVAAPVMGAAWDLVVIEKRLFLCARMVFDQ